MKPSEAFHDNPRDHLVTATTNFPTSTDPPVLTQWIITPMWHRRILGVSFIFGLPTRDKSDLPNKKKKRVKCARFDSVSSVSIEKILLLWIWWVWWRPPTSVQRATRRPWLKSFCRLLPACRKLIHFQRLEDMNPKEMRDSRYVPRSINSYNGYIKKKALFTIGLMTIPSTNEPKSLLDLEHSESDAKWGEVQQPISGMEMYNYQKNGKTDVYTRKKKLVRTHDLSEDCILEFFSK